ncbi:MAG: hypothetical protein ACI9Z7_001199 [Alteromonas macleodii]
MIFWKISCLSTSCPETAEVKRRAVHSVVKSRVMVFLLQFEIKEVWSVK